MLYRWLMTPEPSTGRMRWWVLHIVAKVRRRHPRRCLCVDCWARLRAVHEADQRAGW